MPQLALAYLITCGGTALRAQSDEELLAAEIKAEHAALQRQAGSSNQEDRLRALAGLDSIFMDYGLLWKLMNDADIEVRTAAIQTLRIYFCTHQEAKPLPSTLAREMTLMLEKEVTRKRMAEALQTGHVKVFPASLIVHSALTLNHLYLCHFFTGCASDYTSWQRRVLQPLVTMLMHRSGETEGALSFAKNELLSVISDPATLMKTLRVVMEGLDDTNFPPDQLEEMLGTLWSHPLLGKDAPLELMLLAQFSPRLPSLKRRLLDSPQQGLNKDYTRPLIKEITAAVVATRERLAPPAAREAQK